MPAREDQLGKVEVFRYIDEPDQVGFGVIDYVPGWFIATHHHRTWELIIIDGSSEGPGYTFFDGRWWRADPGSAVFLPQGIPHAWSAGNENGFKMLWIYGASTSVAGRIYDGDPQSFRPISPEEELAAAQDDAKRRKARSHAKHGNEMGRACEKCWLGDLLVVKSDRGWLEALTANGDWAALG